MIIFDKWNVSTRILEGLLNSNLATDNTRASLRKYALEYIQQHYLWGSGLVNDRRLIYDNFSAGVATAYGTYVHNFFLEIMMQIGLIPGLIISVIYVRKIIDILSKVRHNQHIKVMLVFVITGFFPLMVSRSYLSFSNFYLLTGLLCASQLLIKNRKENVTNGEKKNSGI